MRINLSLATILFGGMVFAQAPAGYYNGTEGLTGYELKTKLSQIITANHQDNGYGGLWTTYKTSDIDRYYENDGSILDIYSENPSGTDPYNFKVGDGQCGNYKREGDCYNREHIVPQSLFYKNAPMVSDAHFIVPTDREVNNKRSNYPFGEVQNPTFTSKNGSKLGKNSVGIYTDIVFEPIDEFKGDVARMILYFVTRYESQLPSFKGDNFFDGSTTQSLQKWELDILLKWHNQDPVSKTEIDRNNAIYERQKNRNPYIDNPEWVNIVWSYTATQDLEAPTIPQNLVLGEVTARSVALSWEASTDNVSVSTYDIYVNGVYKLSSATPSVVVTDLSPNTQYSFYIIAKDTSGNSSEKSNSVDATTKTENNDTPTPSTSCGTEDFENTGVKSSKYEDRTWTNNNITWTATNTRTDEKDGTSRVIVMRAGKLTSSTLKYGISSISFKAYIPYSDKNVSVVVSVNGVPKDTIAVSKTPTIYKVKDINISGEVVIELSNPSNRVVIDNLSWLCYPYIFSTSEEKLVENISLYPNPAKNGIIYFKNIQQNQALEIYNLNGQKIKTIEKISANQPINIGFLQKGIYLLKVDTKVMKLIVE